MRTKSYFVLVCGSFAAAAGSAATGSVAAASAAATLAARAGAAAILCVNDSVTVIVDVLNFKNLFQSTNLLSSFFN